MKKVKCICLAAISALWTFSAAAGVKVVDGDSLEIDGVKIRLVGIDAPEYLQICYDADAMAYECGQEALKFMQKMIDEAKARGDKIRCEQVGVDRYKRELSVCYAGKQNLNEEMVCAGWAVVYRHDLYVDAGESARKSKRGLWQGKFMRPELWRILKRYREK